MDRRTGPRETGNDVSCPEIDCAGSSGGVESFQLTRTCAPGKGGSFLKPKAKQSMSELIGQVRSLLGEGRVIRKDLPNGGRLHIDRHLPFLCVYRRLPGENDSGTEKLVLGEASYLIASGEKRFASGLSRLVHMIVKELSAEFGAFLIVEVFATQDGETINGNGRASITPKFRILTSRSRSAAPAVEELSYALGRIKILKRRSAVVLAYSNERFASSLSHIIRPKEARALNCFTIGLGVRPIYLDLENGGVFPLVLREMHRGVARALKKAFFEFAQSQTSHQPKTYQALGRRALVKAVWEADRRLAEISTSFDFLLQVTPTNVDSAWNWFRRSAFSKAPLFYYRPRPVDPAELKGRLYEIPLERIEDPTLASLFREKQQELDRQLTMLEDRGSKNFLYGSLQLFGGVSAELEKTANLILETLPPRSRERSGKVLLRAADFAAAAEREIEYYRELYPAFSAKVQVRDDIVGLMVSQGNLLVGSTVKIPASRVEALLQHEVGTHILTYHNGLAQPFRQLYCGLAGYDELQEGLAVLSEHLVGGLSAPRLSLLAARVVAVKHLTEGASFVETYRQLKEKHGFDQKTAFTITLRVFRAGGLTKDAVYLRGLVRLLDYLDKGAALDNLFVGKIATRHVPIIRELTWRKVLRPFPLRPRYLNSPKTSERLLRLRSRSSILDLIEGRRR